VMRLGGISASPFGRGEMATAGKAPAARFEIRKPRIC
jgi:hypothetical protein